MKEVILFWLVVLLFWTLAALVYASRWYGKHPWHKEIDSSTKLSVNERNYRQKERRKLSNMFLTYFMGMGFFLMVMVLEIQREMIGCWRLGMRWMYVIPFIGMMVLAVSGIKKQ